MLGKQTGKYLRRDIVRTSASALNIWRENMESTYMDQFLIQILKCEKHPTPDRVLPSRSKASKTKQKYKTYKDSVYCL